MRGNTRTSSRGVYSSGGYKPAFDSTADTHLNVSGFKINNANPYNNFFNSGGKTPDPYDVKSTGIMDRGNASPIHSVERSGYNTPNPDKGMY